VTPPDAADVAALVPCHAEPPAEALLHEVRARVGRLLVVDDGLAARPRAALDARARAAGAELLRSPGPHGKGHALAAGLAVLRGDGGRAVVTVDADGQHPPEAIPRFLAAAAHADLVIGDRFAAPGDMPLVRQVANRTTNALLAAVLRRRVRDSQCGMRLLTGRALHDVRFAGGRMEAETAHLKRCARAGVPIAWVPIPARYDGEESAFRTVRDSAAVLRAVLTA
jgi:glycosyltransferase involved in cell wall biosynthesis